VVTAVSMNIDKAMFKAELLANVPWYDALGKRLMVLAPLIAIIANSLINMTINAKNLATNGFGPYNPGPVRLSSGNDQKTYTTVGAYGDLWGLGMSTYQTFSSGYVYFPSVPAVQYVSCAAGYVNTAYVTCNFVNNTAFVGLTLVFVVYFVLFGCLTACLCFRKYPTSDLRFFILAEKFKTTLINRVFVVLGHMITFSCFAVGIYYAQQANSGVEMYGRQLIYLAINVTAFNKLSFSAFPDLKHLDMDAQLPDEISVLPFREKERNFSNGWGCLVRSEGIIRKLEQAVLRAYLSGAPECILKFGDREPLERALYLIHLKVQPGATEAPPHVKQQDDKMPPPRKLLRRASTISVVKEISESSLNHFLTLFFRTLHCDRAHTPVSDEEDEDEKEGLDWQTKRERYIAAHSSAFDHLVRFWLFIVPIVVLAVNGLSNVATIAQTAAQTVFTGYPTNTGTGYPFLLDSVATQAYASKMQAGQFFVPSTNSACSSFGSTTCYSVESTLAFTGMPLWQKCGSNTYGVLESGFICPYITTPTFYALIFIWVAIIFFLAAASLLSSCGFSVSDARRALAENHFRGSKLNRGLACAALGYTLATGITAIVYLPNAIITYFNVFLYIMLNAKAVSVLTQVTSIEITRFPDIATAFPDAVELNLSLVQPSDVLYSLEQALLKSFLTGDDRYIERVADKKVIEAFLAKAYLHDSDEEKGGEDKPSLVGLRAETGEPADGVEGYTLVSVSDSAPQSRPEKE